MRCRPVEEREADALKPLQKAEKRAKLKRLRRFDVEPSYFLTTGGVSFNFSSEIGSLTSNVIELSEPNRR